MTKAKLVSVLISLLMLVGAILFSLQMELYDITLVLIVVLVIILVCLRLRQSRQNVRRVLDRVQSSVAALEGEQIAFFEEFEDSVLAKVEKGAMDVDRHLLGRMEDAVADNRILEKEKTDLAVRLEEVRTEKNNALFEMQRKLLHLNSNLKLEGRKKLLSEIQKAPDKALKELFPQSFVLGLDRKTSEGPQQNFSGDIHVYYGEKYQKDTKFFEKFILRNESLLARETIARAVTNFQHDYKGTLQILRLCRAGLASARTDAHIKRWNVRSLLSLARVLASQDMMSTDIADAINIFSIVITQFGQQSLSTADKYTYLEILSDSGRAEDAEQFMSQLDDSASKVQLSLVRSNILSDKATNFCDVEPVWLDEINAMYRAANLDEIRLTPGAGHPIDRLRPVETTDVIDGPLVSILMPTFNGSDFISTAVKSLLSQSWKNLEVILVDDGSALEHWEFISDKLPSDPRLKIIHLPENRGAYHARNIALGQAEGEYITVHDDDDWSHPQKIEIQIRELLQDSGSVGNMSYMTRMDENCRFIRINDNPEYNQRNYSSMLIAKATLSSVGPWDEVSRAADAEMHERISAIYNKKIQGVLTPPLSFARARTGSLTYGEMRKGYIDPRRYNYGLAFMSWHNQLKSGETKIDPEAISGSPFVRPVSMVRQTEKNQDKNYDIIYITDFRFPGGNSTLVAAEIRAAVDSGLNVGIAQLDSPSLRATRPFNAKITSLLDELDVDFLTTSDEVSCALLVLRHPTILQYADNLISGITGRRIALIVNNPPLGPDGVEAVFDLEVCADHAAKAFGGECIVYPESWQIRQLCLQFWPDLQYAVEDWPGFLDPEGYVSKDLSMDKPARAPVIGRHSRDHRLKWPDNIEKVVAAYLSSSFETLILGGADSIRNLLTDTQWSALNVIGFGEMDPVEYLSQIDFWVYFHSNDLTESFGMSIIEAMASGVPVILPKYMEKMFGEGAIYCEPEDVPRVVEKYWNDRPLYLAQARKGIEKVEKFYSVSSYQERLLRLTSTHEDWPVALSDRVQIDE